MAAWTSGGLAVCWTLVKNVPIFLPSIIALMVCCAEPLQMTTLTPCSSAQVAAFTWKCNGKLPSDRYDCQILNLSWVSHELSAWTDNSRACDHSLFINIDDFILTWNINGWLVIHSDNPGWDAAPKSCIQCMWTDKKSSIFQVGTPRQESAR